MAIILDIILDMHVFFGIIFDGWHVELVVFYAWKIGGRIRCDGRLLCLVL